MKFNSQGLLLLQGDVLEVLGTLPDESVHCCVTSPPYWGLRDYGVSGQLGLESTPDEYVANMVAVFRDVRRVLRDDGVLWLNLGDSYARQGGKTDGVPRHWDGRKQDPGGMHAKRSVASEFGAKPKDLVGIPWQVAFAMKADGWYLRSGMPWVRRAAMPDSTQDRPGSALEYVFLLAKSERYYFDMEAVRRAPSGISGGAKFGKVSLDGPGSRECTAEDRERYAAQGRQWRNADLWFESVDAPHGLCGMGDELVGIDVNPRGFKGAHFATFPEALIRPLIRAGSSDNGCCGVCGAPRVRQVEDRGDLLPVDYEGKNVLQDKQHSARRMLANVRAAREAGADHDNPFPPKKTVGWEFSCDCQPASESPCIVLDPFLGSGTTALVSRDLGRRCIGIELNPAYLEMARERMKQGVLPL